MDDSGQNFGKVTNDSSMVLPVPNGSENPSLVEAILTPMEKGILSSQGTTMKTAPKLLITRSKQKYKLIRKSPLKGSPVKSVTHILHKQKKVKGLSPRKLKFILPKVTKFSPRKKKVQRILRSKPLSSTSLNNKLIAPEGQDCEQSSERFNPGLGIPSSAGEPCLSVPEPPLVSESIQSSIPPLLEGPDNCEKLGECPRSEEENEEEDAEMQQQKEHLAAFLKASSTIAFGQRTSDKRSSTGSREQQRLTKQQRRLQDRITALSLEPDLVSQQDALVHGYLMRARNALTSASDNRFGRFLDALNGIVTRGDSVEKVFPEVMEILNGFPDLQGGFVMFLRPDQAIRVGKYDEFCEAQRLREFVYELKYHLRRQPQILQKVSRTLQVLVGQESVDSDLLVDTLAPLLKLQPLLVERLSHIFPWSKPPQSLPEDFEEISLDQSESPDPQGFEHINLIDDDAKPPPENCPCDCHPSQSSPQTNPPPVVKLDHCISCALRFIDGRVFLLSGRSLRPASVTFHKEPLPQGDVGKETPLVPPLCKEPGDRGPPPRSAVRQPPPPIDRGTKGSGKGPTPRNLSEPTSEGDKPRKGRKTKKN